MSGNDFQAVRDAASESLIGRTAVWVGDRLRVATADSWFRRRIAHSAALIESWSTEDRVRYTAAAIAIAGIVNIALLSLVGRYPAPGIPKAVVALAAGGAALVAYAPHAFIAAWPGSTLARAVTKAALRFQNNAE